MPTLKESLHQLHALNIQIERIIKDFGYEIEQIEYNYHNLDEAFLRDQVSNIAYKLDSISNDIAYLAKSVVEEGIIHHNSDGRYELPSGTYFTSGSICEILSYDSYHEMERWNLTSIEHNGTDYYATALGKDISIDGKYVRIRRWVNDPNRFKE